MELTDKESHYIQNEIDLVMDMIRDDSDMTTSPKGNNTMKVLMKLEEIRDSIPCCCDGDAVLGDGCIGNKYGYPVDK